MIVCDWCRSSISITGDDYTEIGYWQLHNKCLRQLETAVNSGIMHKILNPKSESVNNFSFMIDGDTYTYAYSSQLGELSILDPNGKLSYFHLSKSDKEVASLNLGELNEDISSL